MSVLTVLPVDSDYVRNMSNTLGEPAWVTELRLAALESAAKLDLPKLEKTRIDRWNLGSYGKYKAENRVASTAELQSIIGVLPEEEQPGTSVLVQRNSSVVYTKLAEDLAAKGVVFTDLHTAMRDHEKLVRPYFLTAVGYEENRFTALHAAIWNGGVFVYVPRGVVIDVPLQAYLHSDDPEATFAPHIVIVAEDNSKVTYVDNRTSAGDDKLIHSAVVEIFAKPGAHVRFASIHNLGESVTDLCYRRAVVDNDASIEWIVGEMNHGDSMTDTSSVLRGGGSSSDAKVINVGTKKQRLNLTTRAVHIGRNSKSQMLTRAVMKDEASAIINGITKIEKGATGAFGEQTEKVLMLSPKARGDANPMLLIDEDEVMAGHAASAGQVNPEHIHYLMSRGITKEAAEKLIIYGFLAPIVSEIPIESLEEQLQQLVERKLGS